MQNTAPLPPGFEASLQAQYSSRFSASSPQGQAFLCTAGPAAAFELVPRCFARCHPWVTGCCQVSAEGSSRPRLFPYRPLTAWKRVKAGHASPARLSRGALALVRSTRRPAVQQLLPDGGPQWSRQKPSGVELPAADAPQPGLKKPRRDFGRTPR